MIGQPAPMGLTAPAQPQYIPNPAFAQWAQMAQGWLAEKQKRQQQFAEACELIRSDAVKRYKIDIEADSTIAADEQAEKQARTEFLTAITPFLQAVLPQMQATPALAPLGKELILFAVRGFRVSRQLEEAFETALDHLAKAPTQPPPGKGNTKSPMEVQSEAEVEQVKAQVAMADVHGDMAEAQLKAQASQEANALKAMQTQAQLGIEQAKLEAQREHDAAELALRNREMQGREALDAARISRIEARNTQGLV